MTHDEKIVMLKDTIYQLYSKEGRSLVYISKLLDINRRNLTYKIKEFGFVKANINKLTPSNEKFANKNKNLIISRLMNDYSVVKISAELSVGRDYLINIIKKTPEISIEYENYINRTKANSVSRLNTLKQLSSHEYDFDDLEGEAWNPIVGYVDYFISNKGRVKKYVKTYDSFFLMKLVNNSKNGRIYVTIDKKTMQISRLVAHSFVDGYSSENNTVEHIDNNVTNNNDDNLMWVSQSENNRLAYEKGKRVSIAYSKNNKFEKIILNDEYEFKTIIALAKFLDVSETQVQRYIDKECDFNGKIEFIY